MTSGFAAISVRGQLATLTSNTAASGQATFAGNIELDDTAPHVAMIDRA